jgi:tellurite resistance protein TehA-like permease
MNGFYESSIKSSSYFINELYDRLNYLSYFYMVLFILATIILFLTIIIILPYIIMINESKKDILSLFLTLKD